MLSNSVDNIEDRRGRNAVLYEMSEKGSIESSGGTPEFRAIKIWKIFRSGYQSPILELTRVKTAIPPQPTNSVAHVADTEGNHSSG